MTSTDLVAFEAQLKPLAPRFSAVLAGQIPQERFARTLVTAVERTPKLLSCDRGSLFASCMSAAVLALEVGDVTGQCFIIPYGTRAQLVIGYRGFNTLAARGGITVTGGVVREGDDVWDFQEGSGGFVKHKKSLARPQDRSIIATWSVGESNDRPPIIAVIGIDEIMMVKAKSPGAKKSDSPWNEPLIGFPAMAEKTAKRRLSRSMPMMVAAMKPFMLAARMDEAAEEEGKPSYLDEHGELIIDGAPAQRSTPYQISPTPTAIELTGSAGPVPTPAGNGEGGAGSSLEESPAPPDPEAAQRFMDYAIDHMMHGGLTATELRNWWASEEQKRERRRSGITQAQVGELMGILTERIGR